MATATQVVAEFGAHYIKGQGGQNIKDLIGKIYEKTPTSGVLTLVPTEDTVVRRASASLSRVLQPFQKTYTSLGAATFLPRSIELQKVKVDIIETPDDIEATWLGFLAANKLKREDWPLIKWWLTEVVKQAKEDEEVNEIYKGVVVPVTPGTPGAASTAIRGIKKAINDAHTAGVAPIATGAPNADNAIWVGQVENFYEAIPEKFWPYIEAINMSEANAAKFRRGMRAKYNMNYDQAGSMLQLIDHPQVKINGLRSMAGENKIWATVKGNGLYCVKRPETKEVFNVEAIDRSVKLWSDWWVGAGFLVQEYIFANDQNLS